MNIPLVAVSYSVKTRSILNQIKQDCFIASEVTSEKIIAKIESLIHTL